MTRVKIDTPGVTVEIDADEPMDAVKAAALDAFHTAGGWPQAGEGPAAGFTTERRYTPPAQPSAMRWAPGPYPEQAIGFREP